MSEWIDVNDRLPEIPEGKHGLSVLIAYLDNDPERSYVTQVSYNKEGFREYILAMDKSSWGEGPVYHQITHWMPLPEPPLPL